MQDAFKENLFGFSSAFGYSTGGAVMPRFLQ